VEIFGIFEICGAFGIFGGRPGQLAAVPI